MGESVSRTYGVSTSIPQFGPRSNPTRYTDVYPTRPHKSVLIFSFLAGTTALSIPRNFSFLISYLYNMSQGRLTVVLRPREVITLLSSPTRGSSFFGGFNGHEVFDDVHILDLAAAAYLPQVTSFSIDAQ